MNAGKLAVLFILASGVIGGAAIFYLQVFGYYSEVAAPDIALSGAPVEMSAFEGIDAASSPIRYRACFALADPAALDAAPEAQAPEPLTAPFWFDCYDAETIAGDIAAGRARAVMLGVEERPGVDRLAAIYPDGTGFAWHQLNPRLTERTRVE